MKRFLLVFACTALAAFGLMLPARAGVGFSEECSNGSAWGTATEVRVADTPITFNIEVGGTPVYLIVCYSTTPKGDATPAITGGHIWIDDPTNSIACRPDGAVVIAVECWVWADTGGVDVRLNPRIQSTSLPIRAGVFTGTLDAPACLRGLTIITPSGMQGPFDVGVC